MPGSPIARDVEATSPPSAAAAAPPDWFRYGLLAWILLLLTACLIIRAGEAINHSFNPDEFHFLHSAWMVGNGYLPYRDFWTNHSPLFIYLLRPLVVHYDGDPIALFAVTRLLAWIVNLGLFGLVAAIAARDRSWPAGMLAALLLSVNITLFQVTVTVRHDSLTVIWELLALLCLARGIRSGHSRDVLAGGVCLGLAFAMTPKALFGLSALVLGYLVHHMLSSSGIDRPRSLIRLARPLLLFLVGSLGMFALVVLFLLPTEVWPLMFRLVFLDSLNNPDRPSALSGYLLREIRAEPIAWLLMLVGFGVAARQWWVGSGRRDPAETLLLVAGPWWGVTYLFLMSSPYHQSALPFLAVLSIFGGRLLGMGVNRLTSASSRTDAVAWATSLMLSLGWMAIGPAWSILPEHPPFQRMNGHQIRTILYVLSLTGPEDAVFDGLSLYIFRPQASYYGSLIRAIRMRIERGELAFDLPERCERLNCKVVIMSDRVARLPDNIQNWIRDNYTPLSPAFPRVLLHRSFVLHMGNSGGH